MGSLEQILSNFLAILWLNKQGNNYKKIKILTERRKNIKLSLKNKYILNIINSLIGFKNTA